MALRDLISPKTYPISTPRTKLTGPDPVVVEDDVAPLEKSLSAGRTTLEQLKADQTRMGGEAANLTLQIARDTANLVSYRNEQEVFKAQQKVTESKELETNIKKMLDDERNSPQYKEKERINKELAELGSFVPTEVTAPMLGVLFSAIGATGMLLGGNSKNTAKAALSAMNGMAEGFAKGREQYDKERKAAFDTNVKLLQTKLSAIKDGLEDARREAILDKEASDMKVRQTLASNEAQFLQENTNKRGLESTIALVDGQLKNLNRAIQFQTTKSTQLAGQLDAKETQLAMRRIEADRRQAESAASREFRAQQAESDRALRAQIAQGQLASQQANRELNLEIANLKAQGSSKATQQNFIAQRAVTALRGAASTMETVMKLPQDARVGFLPFLSTKEGMYNFVQNAAGRRMSSEEEKAVETLYAGMSRYLASIEASGTATGLAGLSEQLRTVYPKSGDSVYDVALKIADTRRIATEAISAMVESGLLPGQQAQAAQEQIQRMERAIPFTTNDVIEARFGGKKTLGGATAIVSKPKVGTPATPAKTTSGATVSNW